MASSYLSSYCILFAISMFSFQLIIATGNNETERLALLDIKHKIRDDPLGVMSSWNDALHYCQWNGVTCDHNYEGVTILDLQSSNLTGTLSSHIGNLSSLTKLRLQKNSFGGSIPSEIGRLFKLSTLLLSSNNFVGEIPWNISNCYSLTVLYLEENMLHGMIPPSISNLSKLTHLSLRQNDLHGSLPMDLGNTLQHLSFLSMGTNRLTGPIPHSLSNLTNLQVLQLNDNNLQGEVPSLHKLERLSDLGLSNNFLGYDRDGDLHFVTSLANATNLQWLQIDQNNFNGDFPQIICIFSNLTRLVIHHNHITGEIPSCIGGLAKLQIFLANHNALSGTLPHSISKLQELYLLVLSDNQISGIIPHSIGNLTKLTHFSLSNNRIVGEIPTSLGKCPSLTKLYLGNNSLSGSIPSELFSLLSLSTINEIDLSINNLTGHLPEEVGRLKNVRIFLVSKNKLSGQIPSSLSSCTALEFLYLPKNNFQGRIPVALQSLKGLVELDLSYNNLSGEIPQFLASLQLLLLNISHNNLEGEVPTGGIFNNATTLLVGANYRLCGGIPELKLPKCHDAQTRRSNHKKLAIVLCISLLGIIFLLVTIVLLYILCKRKRTNKEPTSLSHLEYFPNLSYSTLFKATNGFSKDNLIGSGSFGVVYKGTLKEDNSKIAIKVFKLEFHGALKSFIAECAVLRSIRHRNLLKVITACSSVDNQGRDFKALVYEYMVNGSLDEWLHPKHNNASWGVISLRKRLDIAVDVAFSLDYLHHHCGAPIVHCDLKPSNVLLDHEMVARVGDFGLAKILSQGIDSYNTHQSSTIGLRGTIGYTPPEYGLGNDVTTSGDVYSFGILILEMFSGKRPTSDTFKGGLSLHCFVQNGLAETITTIVDNAILKDINREESEREIILEALQSIFQVALSCSMDAPRERLDMTDVATKLSSIRNNLLTTHLYQNAADFSSMYIHELD